MDRVEQIVEVGRRTRQRSSRGLWIVAGLLGVVCLVGFALIFVADPEPVAATPARPRSASGGSFWSGLGVGAGVGIAIGYVLARRSRSQSSGAPDHSSRNSP